jgi:hypothetical protein
MNDERRAQPRLNFAGRAYLTYNGRCRVEDVLDVSADGLQLVSDARLKPGKPVKVFLPVPHGDGFRLALLKGQVARRCRVGRGQYRLGITLERDALDTRRLLTHYIDRQAS